MCYCYKGCKVTRTRGTKENLSSLPDRDCDQKADIAEMAEKFDAFTPHKEGLLNYMLNTIKNNKGVRQWVRIGKNQVKEYSKYSSG